MSRSPRHFATAAVLLVGMAGCTRPPAERRAQTISSLHVIVSAQANYAKQYGGFACELKSLGPPLRNMKASSDAAGLVDADLAKGEKQGYKFVVSSCSETGRSYRVVAVPLQRGKTGDYSFCTDQTGVIRYAEEGTADDCLGGGKRLADDGSAAQ